MLLNRSLDFLVLIGLSVLLVCGSSERTEESQEQFCIKSSTVGVPKCKVTFREEGTFNTFQPICWQQNDFLILPNRTKPSDLSDTADIQYLTSVYDDQLPPYVRVSCSSTYPTDFGFDGVGALDFFRIWKGVQKEGESTVFTINAEVLLSPEATGSYVFHSLDDSKLWTEFFVFSERGSKPYLIGGDRVILAYELNDTATVFPCISSDVNVEVTLFNVTKENILTKFTKPYVYDRKLGFIIPSHMPPGDYRCYATNNTEDIDDVDDDDYVTVRVPYFSFLASALLGSHEPKVGFEIQGTRAVCYSMKYSNLHFSNAHTQNPTESRLLIDCLEKKHTYCGSHSYHKRKEGHKIQRRRCPHDAPSCLWIIGFHSQGIFYCDAADGSRTGGGSAVTQTYFTGLDGIIYDAENASFQAPDVLIKPQIRRFSNTQPLNLKTGEMYKIQCEAAGLVFIGDKYTISARLRNGSMTKLAEIYYWQQGTSLLLTADMEELLCTDYLWNSDHLVTNGVKINVSKMACGPGEFQCHNDECIPDHYRCNGDRMCQDGSDEMDCTNHHCKPGLFQCVHSGVCISDTNKCNNADDCGDGSDESLETCSDTVCGPLEFKCLSGQCTYLDFLCDGKFDCFDKSDEVSKHCSKYYPTFVQTPTDVSFILHTRNELVCQANSINTTEKLKPKISWLRDGKNISLSEPERLWQDISGLKLALRFENISLTDEGEYVCFATNRLQEIEQKFIVKIDNTNSAVMIEGKNGSPQSAKTTQSDSSGSGTLILICVLVAVIFGILCVTVYNWRRIRPSLGSSCWPRNEDQESVIGGMQLQTTAN